MAATKLLFILVQISTINVIINTTSGSASATILVFGDSTVETGNNNFVTTTLVRADHLPYGQGFPGRVPTGRFSNGKLLPDFLAGIKDVYLDPKLSNNNLQNGVCFASARSGYDDLTTAVTGAITFSKQLTEALLTLSAGTNDFILNYYDIPTRRQQFNNLSAYQDFLQTALQNYIKDQNSDSQAYNQTLVKLLTTLQRTLPRSRIVYADVYETVIDMVNNPQKYGRLNSLRW
ncbi:hypothetical protein Q3G72_012925 [Acer saccharum]|nr:hypothetical protein Q3G72_012925 [Acer saccharum]